MADTNVKFKDVLGYLKNIRTEIAELVYPIWKANRPEAQDRGIALNMLISNARAKGEPLYSWGTLTEEQQNKAREYFKGMTKYEVEREYTAINKILNKLVWEE